LPVLFAIDRAGVVGPDGPTHAGSFDLSFLRCIPNMTIMTPSDENECQQMLYTGFHIDGPTAVRYPRGYGPGVSLEKNMELLPIGKAEMRREGQNVALLAFGSTLLTALEAAQQLNATVINMRFVKPLDDDIVLQLAATHELLVTIEDNAVMGGAGSAVNECLAAHNINQPIINLGLADYFGDQGSREELLSDYHLDVNGIIAAVSNYFQHQSCQISKVRLNSY